MLLLASASEFGLGKDNLRTIGKPKAPDPNKYKQPPIVHCFRHDPAVALPFPCPLAPQANCSLQLVLCVIIPKFSSLAKKSAKGFAAIPSPFNSVSS